MGGDATVHSDDEIKAGENQAHNQQSPFQASPPHSFTLHLKSAGTAFASELQGFLVAVKNLRERRVGHLQKPGLSPPLEQPSEYHRGPCRAQSASFTLTLSACRKRQNCKAWQVQDCRQSRGTQQSSGLPEVVSFSPGDLSIRHFLVSVFTKGAGFSLRTAQDTASQPCSNSRSRLR